MTRETVVGVGKAFAVVAILVGIWYVGAFLLQLSGDRLAGSKLPFPHTILEKVLTYPETILEATWATGSRAVMGFFIGLAVGVGFGTLMVQARWLEVSVLPYVLASQMIPLIALVPIMRAVLRDPELVRLYLAAYVTFFIVTMAVLKGLKSVDRNSLELMDSYNASRWTIMRTVRFPAALPYIFSGLKIAAPLSLVGAIIVDLTGAQNSLGYLMVAAVAIGPSQSGFLWAALIIACCLGLLFARIVTLIERRVSPWQRAFRETAT
ncbi:MAG TPA: ABC transporter permease [Candidatus Saccharimonadales bacterium]|nr:ABC transporter permease [Candidatus Saccharimonadales bacterium]